MPAVDLPGLASQPHLPCKSIPSSLLYIVESLFVAAYHYAVN
jgi:hypothetical protein